MTFEQQLKDAVAQAQVAHEAKHMESLSALLTNPAFIDAQRSIAAKDAELNKLNTIINQLNQIKPFVAKDGTKYAIKCYPVSFFGTGLAQVIGIISASRSAFTDELALQYSAITGISIIELMEANEALGAPAYISKAGVVNPAITGNLPKLRQLLASIMLKLNIQEFSPESITQDRIDLWFTKAELAVQLKQAEIEVTNTINSSSEFTIED
jgi:multidrug efflux pump subunit AcrA (membrane-fusion protein)